MNLWQGQLAYNKAQEIIGHEKIPILAVDPFAVDRGQISVLVIANTKQAVTIDATQTQNIDKLLQSHNGPWGAYNAKNVHKILLKSFNISIERWACVKLCQQLIDGGRQYQYNLPHIASLYNMPTPPPLDSSLDDLKEYAKFIAKLISKMIPQLNADRLSAVSKIEAAAVAPIAEMEFYGMPFQADCWQKLNMAACIEQTKLEKDIKQYFSTQSSNTLFGDFDINLSNDRDLKKSLKQIGFDLPDVRRKTLNQVPPPLGTWLSRYKELFKMISTYGETFLQHVASDSRIHPTFEQIGASTGRISCRSPNLQAIVKSGPYRQCFRCRPNRCLVIGDYATCELRILAEMSSDPVFHQAFLNNEDLHATVASKIFGESVSKTSNVTLRDRAKAINFGLVYGMSAYGLARVIHCDHQQAQNLLRQYFTTFPSIQDFLTQTARESIQRGFSQTLSGRRLYLPEISEHVSRGQIERLAKNMPIQGSSADITKIALARIRNALKSLYDSAAIVNTVHDEIVVECDTNNAPQIQTIVQTEMKNAGQVLLKEIPVVVDIQCNEVWSK